MTHTFSIGFIGGGNMANALIKGLIQNSFNAQDMMVIDPDANKRTQLSETLHIKTSEEIAHIGKQDVIVLAVKPQNLKEVALKLAPHLTTQLIISIAAGIRLADLSRWLGNYNQLIRTMPNTPAQIQAGATGLYAMPTVSETQKMMAETILSATGIAVWVDQEDKLDAVTAISGSGPAYVFYLIEALHEAGVALGLSDEQAKLLATHTFKGASLLAELSTLPIQTLREQVTSKGGTTEQGLLSLADSQVKEAMMKAAHAAAKRAKILGDELGNQ